MRPPVRNVLARPLAVLAHKGDACERGSDRLALLAVNSPSLITLLCRRREKTVSLLTIVADDSWLSESKRRCWRRTDMKWLVRTSTDLLLCPFHRFDGGAEFCEQTSYVITTAYACTPLQRGRDKTFDGVIVTITRSQH